MSMLQNELSDNPRLILYIWSWEHVLEQDKHFSDMHDALCQGTPVNHIIIKVYDDEYTVHGVQDAIHHAPELAVLRRWCYRYSSGIILDHSIILIWIFDPESRIITRISLLDQPSRLVHQLVTIPLPDLHINRSITEILSMANTMCIIFGSIMVVGSLPLMVTPYRQETLFVVVDQATIHTRSIGLFLGWWGVVSIRALWPLEVCRVI